MWIISGLLVCPYENKPQWVLSCKRHIGPHGVYMSAEPRREPTHLYYSNINGSVWNSYHNKHLAFWLCETVLESPIVLVLQINTAEPHLAFFQHFASLGIDRHVDLSWDSFPSHVKHPHNWSHPLCFPRLTWNFKLGWRRMEEKELCSKKTTEEVERNSGIAWFGLLHSSVV